jgi:hypothetical protein
MTQVNVACLQMPDGYTTCTLNECRPDVRCVYVTGCAPHGMSGRESREHRRWATFPVADQPNLAVVKLVGFLGCAVMWTQIGTDVCDAASSTRAGAEPGDARARPQTAASTADMRRGPA